MFSLAYSLAESVQVDGVEYPLNLTFDNVLRLIDLMNDDELSDVVQVETAIVMLLGTELDCDIQKKDIILNSIFEKVIGKDEEESVLYDIAGNPMPVAQEQKEQYYCLTQDAEYIYASFWMDYQMDLFEQQGKLHWDKFRALLNGLSSETIFQKIIEIRSAELPTGKGTGEERKRLIELKERYKLNGQQIKIDEEFE